MVAYTIGINDVVQYNVKDKNINNLHGVVLSNGSTDGLSPLILRTQASIDNTLRVGAKVDLGGQIAFTRTGCGNWYTTSGLNMFGTLKGDCNINKTKGTGTARDGLHEYTIYGGGGVEIAARQTHYDAAIGFKAGYEYNNVITTNKDIIKDCKNGRVVYGPTARAKFWIPKTEFRTTEKGGLGIGVNAEYDIANKNVNVEACVSYTF